MSKSLIIFFKYLIIFIGVSVFNGCSSNNEEDEALQYQTIYNSLNNNQSKFIFKIDGNDFYQTESIFKGHLEMLTGSFTINYFDQFNSNVMVHFGGQKWNTARPIKSPVKLDNGYSSNVMFGKIINKDEKIGVGYLMYDGLITFKVFTKEKIIIIINGKARKYPKVDEESPSFDVKATLICKNPSFDVVDIDGKESFYGQ